MSEKSIDQPRVGTAVLVLRHGEFLFMKRKGSHGSGTWSTPGGHLEFGESFGDCAKREVMEETGMTVTNVRVMGVTNDLFADENKQYVTVWLIAHWQSGEPQIMEPEKCDEQRWVDFGSLPDPLFASYPNLFTSDFFGKIKDAVSRSKTL